MSTQPDRKITNGEAPAKAPLRRMGAIPVLARVTWTGGDQEWRAATALRWTDTHVMVTWRDERVVPRVDRFEWFRGQDVMRSATWVVGVPEPASAPRVERRTAEIEHDQRPQREFASTIESSVVKHEFA